MRRLLVFAPSNVVMGHRMEPKLSTKKAHYFWKSDHWPQSIVEIKFKKPAHPPAWSHLQEGKGGTLLPGRNILPGSAKNEVYYY